MQIDYKLVVVLLVAILCFIWFRKDHKATEELSTQIEQNDARIDSLNTVLNAYDLDRRTLNIQITTLNDSITVLNALLASNELQINELKRKRNEKVNAVNKYASNDILKFLTNRYYGSKDSTSTPKDSVNQNP